MGKGTAWKRSTPHKFVGPVIARTGEAAVLLCYLFELYVCVFFWIDILLNNYCGNCNVCQEQVPEFTLFLGPWYEQGRRQCLLVRAFFLCTWCRLWMKTAFDTPDKTFSLIPTHLLFAQPFDKSPSSCSVRSEKSDSLSQSRFTSASANNFALNLSYTAYRCTDAPIYVLHAAHIAPKIHLNYIYSSGQTIANLQLTI